MMYLRLASLNGSGLNSDSKRSQLLLNLQRRTIDICCLQETYFDSNFRKGILPRDYLSLSAYFDGRSGRVTWLISKRLISCSFRSGSQTLHTGCYLKGQGVSFDCGL